MFEALATELAKERVPTPLSEFLAAIPGSWEMQIFWGLLGSGTLGMLSVHLMRYLRGEIRGNIFRYWLAHWKKTLLSFLTYAGIAAEMAAKDGFTGEYGGFVGWGMVLTWGWGVGAGIHAVVHKSEMERRTDIDRLTKRKPG